MRLLAIAKPEIYEGQRLLEEGRRLGHQVEVTPYTGLVFEVGQVSADPAEPIKTAVLYQGTPLTERFDAGYIRYFYPYVSEALMLAEWADSQGLTVIDANLATDNFVQSKMYAAWRLAEAGLPVPPGFQTMTNRLAKERLAGLNQPIIAKGVHGSKGKYVYLLDRPAEALDRLDDEAVGFFTFQRKLEIDTEYRALVLNGQLLGAVSKSAIDHDFRRNASLGGQVTAARLPTELRKISESAARTLGYQLAGVDLAISDGRPYILEVNRSPGFQAFEEATGINVAAAFLEMVSSAVATRCHRQ